LKGQNIKIKPLLKPKNAQNKLCFKTAYLGLNEKMLLQKVALNVSIFGLLHLFRKSQ
jgi:hypothetical protein